MRLLAFLSVNIHGLIDSVSAVCCFRYGIGYQGLPCCLQTHIDCQVYENYIAALEKGVDIVGGVGKSGLGCPTSAHDGALIASKDVRQQNRVFSAAWMQRKGQEQYVDKSSGVVSKENEFLVDQADDSTSQEVDKQHLSGSTVLNTASGTLRTERQLAGTSFVELGEHKKSECCFRIGYGAMMKPCCLRILDSCDEYYAQKSSSGLIIGGGIGRSDGKCPADAEAAAKMIQKESEKPKNDGGNDHFLNLNPEGSAKTLLYTDNVYTHDGSLENTHYGEGLVTEKESLIQEIDHSNVEKPETDNSTNVLSFLFFATCLALSYMISSKFSRRRVAAEERLLVGDDP